MSEAIVYLNDQDFQEKTKEGVVLVDFYADWCGPCRMLTPILEQIAKEMQGQVKVAKLDIDGNQKSAAGFQVTSVPTMILFKNGKEVNRLVGLRDLSGIKKFIATAV